MSDSMEEFRRNNARAAFWVHLVCGTIAGAIGGLIFWMTWGIRSRHTWHPFFLDSWFGLVLFIVAGAVIVGALAASLKEQFWKDLSNPFIWW
jgi:hypothetical protein